MKRPGLLWVSMVAVITVGCSRTERTTPQTADRPAAGAAVGTGGAGTSNANSDEDFVHDVAMMSMAEIELSRMALSKGTSAGVKSFAQRMIDEHVAAADKLKTAVSALPGPWPAQLDDKRQKSVDELAKQQGADFDRAYVKAMVEAHQDLAAKLESRLDVRTLADWKAAAAGRTQSKALPEPNAEMRDVVVRPEKSDKEITMKINQWAADTYPLAQKHLDTASTLETTAKKPSTH